MDKTYDLNLPEWGPYNKKYLGAAHVADKLSGLRFDVALFPGFYRRSVMLPKDLMDSGAKMLASSADASHFIYRYELEWKDKVFIDADFSSDDNIMTIKCKINNNTDLPESVTLNACMSLHGCSQNHVDIHAAKPVLSNNSVWIDALSYDNISCAADLAVDGLYLGEVRESDFVGGSFLGSEFFNADGHFAAYSFPKIEASEIGIRYRGKGRLKINLGDCEFIAELPESNEISYKLFKFEKLSASSLKISPLCDGLDIDGFVLGECESARFEHVFSDFSPEISEKDGKIILTFGEIEYIVEPTCGEYTVRKIVSDDIGQTLSEKIHDHVSTVLIGNGSEETADLFIRPIFVDAHSAEEITIKITARKNGHFEANHEIYTPCFNPEGERYTFSQKTMAAVTATNVVWPIYSRHGFIRHNTPGRNWDSLYTWDSGFIGLGLSSIDIRRAKDCLNAYLTPPGDVHSPCIFHGSPLPIQIFLYSEIFDKTGDTEFLKEYFPLIKNQYNFYSRMKNEKYGKATGIFSLWHVFYNSGGWDDYPAQRFVHENKLEETAKPVINTAVTVLCAKILKNLAELIGEDTSVFESDIKFFSDVVNKYAWDEESGYYGYIDTTDTPKIIKNMGVNANMGLDGAYPYIAGIADDERSKILLENIKAGMMTEIGLGVVDKRAPYYSNSGYWNGSVWMPHQWILWKSLLDHGEFEFANELAKTALELWKTETDHTYNCYEHFMVKNGRGAGFHQFSGLSTPVLLWGEAYFKPFSVTCGFLGGITEKSRCGNNLKFKFKGCGTVLVCLPEGKNYSFETTANTAKINNGTYALTFSSQTDEVITATERTNL